MLRHARNILLDDNHRGDDRRSPSSVLLGKPPVLRRRSLNATGLCLLSMVLYGSLMPFQFDHLSHGSWVLPWHRPVASDMMTNLLLYVPIGVFLRLFFRRRKASPLFEIALSLLVIASLSYFTEVCQTILSWRVPSMNDVVSNVSGAAVGILLAPLIQRIARNIHGWLYVAVRSQPFTAAATTMAICMVFYALMPFDLSINPAALHERLHDVAHAESLLPFGGGFGGDHSMSLSQAANKVVAVMAYGLLAFLLTFSAKERKRSNPSACRYAFLRCLGLVSAVELAQLFTVSHVFDPADLTGGWICAAIGTLIAAGWLSRCAKPRPEYILRVIAVAGCATILLWITLPILASPAVPASEQTSHTWLPMMTHFHQAWSHLLGAYTVGFIQYAIFAGVLAAWQRSQKRVPGEWLIVSAAMGLALAMIALDAWLGHPVDSFHLLLACLASIFIHRGDRSLFAPKGQPQKEAIKPPDRQRPNRSAPGMSLQEPHGLS